MGVQDQVTYARVGLLTARGYPLLGYVVDRVSAIGGVDVCVIVDSKDVTDRDHRLFAERTDGGLAARPFVAGAYPSTMVSDHNGPDTLDFVRETHIDLLLNVCTPRIIGSDLLHAPPFGIVNVHPGILPKYRGASCCEWAIYNDDPVGVTAHFMDEGLDSGPIIFTRQLAVTAGQTYPQVRVSLYRLWVDACGDAVADVLNRRLTPKALPPQPDAPVFKPISDALMTQVKAKLTRGAYCPVRSGH